MWLVAVAILALGTNSEAQWSRDPQRAIHFNGVLSAKLVSDSMGGVFLFARGGDWRGYCYYIDSNGYPRWNQWVDTSPLAAANEPTNYAICPQLGCIVFLGYSLWISEDGDTSWDIRAQRIDSTGEFLWPDSGISVANMRLRFEDNADFAVIGMEADGKGGVIVLWVILHYRMDQWGNTYLEGQSYHAGRIDRNGERIWDTLIGETVDEDSLHREGFRYLQERTVSDGTEGIIMIYGAEKGIGAQRISSMGEKLWGEVGVRYHFEYVTWPNDSKPDGDGGVVISAHDQGDGRDRVLAFRLDRNG